MAGDPRPLPTPSSRPVRPALPLHGAGAGWASTDEDLTLRCIDVRAETHDVRTFAFTVEDGRWVDFQAGQYLPLTVEIDGEPQARCYSLSSSALRPGVLSVTVKRVAGGRVSNWLHDHLRPGMTLQARPPAGLFVLPAVPPAVLPALPAASAASGPGGAARADSGDSVGLPPMLMASGGSGITPLMAMLRTLADACCHPDIVFLHAGRTPADLVFRDELQWRARTTPGLRLHFLPEALGTEAGWVGPTGRLDAGLLQALVPDVARRHVLCCGPAPFMAAVRTLSAAAGVPAAHYSEESFGAEPPPLAAAPSAVSASPAVAAQASAAASSPSAPSAPLATPLATPVAAGPAAAPAPDASAPGWTATFTRQDRQVPVAPGQTVLAAARQAGLRMASSCANGVCGTCRLKLGAGRVEMNHQGGIRQREIDAGFFLPCCAKPLSDLVIEG